MRNNFIKLIMITRNYRQSFISSHASKNILLIFVVILFLTDLPILLSQESQVSVNSFITRTDTSHVIYRNPRVYNVDYTFELCPEKDSIDRSKDLKLWIPVPREWDSQKAVKIISVEPEPHATYEDPEHGNKIYYWDFEKLPAKDTYKVKIRYRTEVFEVYSDIDPEKIGPYDMQSEEYQLYTRSTYTTNINPEIRELSQTAVGNETNPYLKVKRIFEFVIRNMRYKDIKRERGSGIESILSFSFIDSETGERHFEGICDHYSLLFVAMCRAAGIPARGETGIVSWGPWIKEKDIVFDDNRHTQLSPDGLAAARLYGPMRGHIWAEFYIPAYGWIPADPTWGALGYQVNKKLILSKDRDIAIGPNAPQKESEGYGDQWIPLHDGRVNATGWGVWNIAKIRVAKVTILHSSDPFPADGYAEYATNLYPESDNEEKLRNWRKECILSFYNTTKESLDTSNIFEKNPALYADREACLCHLLRQIVGDEKFKIIFETYINLRITTGKPVSTEKFREIAEKVYGASLDFFFRKWVGNNSLPQFRLENVKTEKREMEWRVFGNLIQEGETYFYIPIDLVIETDKGQESHKIWLDSNKTQFEFFTADQPEKLIIDPDFHIPTIRWMPPRLGMFWSSYPNLTVIYGTLAEAEANKTAAKRFVDEFSGSGNEIIKADTAVSEDDLRKSLILFGRPETNKIAQRFSDSFPVKFKKNKFTWQGTIYDQPTQGVAQIIENPFDHQNMINLYAGLSGDATLKVCDKSEWLKELNGFLLIDVNTSYVIYDNYKKLISGDWDNFYSDMVWNFK
jgi:transglutaminase-like putative cysteine protease